MDEGERRARAYSRHTYLNGVSLVGGEERGV